MYLRGGFYRYLPISTYKIPTSLPQQYSMKTLFKNQFLSAVNKVFTNASGFLFEKFPM